MSENRPAITFLNMTGDITISWDAHNEKEMLELVRQKMAEGFTFFILKSRPLGLGKKKVRAKSIDQVKEAGAAILDDKEFAKIMRRLHDPAVEKAVAAGTAKLAQADNVVSLDTVRRAASAEEAVQHQTVAVRRVVGG